MSSSPLHRTSVATDLHDEVGTRWHLVERTWQSKQVDRQPLVLAYERLAEKLRPAVLGARRGWTQSVRPALNGYQRGFCFYCYRPISVLAGGIAGSHVDHLHPHAAIARGVLVQLDDVWNLVLACTACNLSKGSSLPSRRYLQQLHARNEWLIGSHHPLRESVIAATGPKDRWRFLQRVYDDVARVSSRRWEPEPVGPSPFTDLGALKVE